MLQIKKADGLYGVAVKETGLVIGRWPEARQAKAARGAIEAAMKGGMGQAAAIFFVLQAAANPDVVNGYSDAEDEYFV